MKRNDNFAARQFGGKCYLFPNQPSNSSLVGLPVLNETGKWLWDALGVEISLDDLVSKFAKEYGVSHSLAEEDVKSFLSEMSDAGLVEGFTL